MKFIGLLWLLLPAWQSNDLRLGETQHVASLSFDAREFKNAFNTADDRPRLVLVFSPT